MRRKVANARIDMRVTPQRKYFLELATFIGGYDSLSTFMAEAAEKLAQTVLNTVEESRELSPKDRDLLLNFLKNAPEPNKALKAAHEKVIALYQLDESGRGIYELAKKLFREATWQT